MNPDSTSGLTHSISEACQRIAPLWPLNRFVAVNPFVGLAGTPFNEALDSLERNGGCSFALPPGYYRALYHSGMISKEDLFDVVAGIHPQLFKSAFNAKIKDLLSSIQAEEWPEPKIASRNFFSSRWDARHGTRWESFFTDEVSKWCTAYFDQGQALWRMPWKGKPLYAAWREASMRDFNPEAEGLPGWRNFVRRLGDDPELEIIKAATSLNIPAEAATDVFHSLLLSVRGWAGHLQFLAHEERLNGVVRNAIPEILAIRIAYEAALYEAVGGKEAASSPDPGKQVLSTSETILIRQQSAARLWQRAHERAMQRSLVTLLAARNPADQSESTPPAPPSFQAVFCIDVRSEVYRRALEQCAPGGETVGFAGFFGFPIEAIPGGEKSGTSQCPVLLKPVVAVPQASTPQKLTKIEERKRAASSWSSFKSSAVSSFVFVETAGLGFVAKLLRDLLNRGADGRNEGFAVDVSGIPFDTRLRLAAGALRHLGYSKGGLARLVLLCGHGCETKNNPYRSSLDCGACGGNTGESNARTAVAILNQPEVRSGLKDMGILVPEETWFLAGLHNTTTDEVHLFDLHTAPDSHRTEITRLQEGLAKATLLARRERARSLGLDPGSPALNAEIAVRAKDWSQVRPEWGLAGNHAFIAAPRKRTRGLDLGGRVFLHDYHHATDEGEATLELLLTAPVVVASWINLQYFASTIDNAHFGSGDKTIHHVAASLGVYEGNGGDIRTGLPMQSLHDGVRWMHDPIRLSVCVEAPAASIDRVLEKHPEVARLVSNRWIHLFAFSENSMQFLKSDGRGGWSDGRVC